MKWHQALLAAIFFGALGMTAAAQSKPEFLADSQKTTPLQKDTTTRSVVSQTPPDQPTYNNVWGLDILISNDGFGLGTFYRRLFTPDVSGFISFSVSEAKDSRENEQYDPYYQVSYTPGKLNRFLVLPLMLGIQYRLFREDIVDTFRPYVNIGAGPTMILQMPYVDITQTDAGTQVQQVDFFKAIGRGHPHYTAGGFIGVGANFGTDASNVFGVNFRYYFTYLFANGGLPSIYNQSTYGVAGTKKDFGGFFITLNVGMGY